MNIYQKLLAVRKSVSYLQKENTGYQYKYVSSSQVLAAVRIATNEQGLILIPRIVSQKISTMEKKGQNKVSLQRFTELEMTYTWVNADEPGEKIECPWSAQGVDDSEKGLGKALTYAEKYFLLKFFLIPTDADDPDCFQKKTEEQQANRDRGNKATPEQIGKLRELAMSLDLSEEKLKEGVQYYCKKALEQLTIGEVGQVSAHLKQKGKERRK